MRNVPWHLWVLIAALALISLVVGATWGLREGYARGQDRARGEAYVSVIQHLYEQCSNDESFELDPEAFNARCLGIFEASVTIHPSVKLEPLDER